MHGPVGVVPLHIACQFLVLQNYSVLVNYANLDAPLPKSATELPSGYTVFPEIGVAYKYHKNQLTWNAARRYCASYGGNLAVIDSFEKIEYARSINKGDTHVHVGIHRLFDGVEWTEIKNGFLATAIPWRVRTYDEDNSRRCMGLVATGDIGLFACKCNERLSFMCEVPIFKD